MTYTIPVLPGGTYLVRLHFAETTVDAPGKRQFNVEINGTKVLADLDGFQEAGKNKAVIKQIDSILPDSDGNIQLHFYKGAAGQPMVSAIEISPSEKK